MMTDYSDDTSDSVPPEDLPPVQGQVRHHQLSALVPKEIGTGTFSNGVMILTGAYEIVLDFALRMGEQQRIATRVVLPHQVANQLVSALQDNIRNYELRFGGLPAIPKVIPERNVERKPSEIDSEAPPYTGDARADHPENQPEPPSVPRIEDIYHDLKIEDAMLSGRYANAVLIRHSAAEFCFDFITNVYPRSAVSSRVFMAAPHVLPFFKSLVHSLTPPDRRTGDPD